MPDTASLEKLVSRETRTLELFLIFSAKKTALEIEKFIATAESQGQTLEFIRQALIDDFNNNGRIFGEYRNSIKATTNGGINRLRDDGLFSEFGVDQAYRWAAVLVNTCPDCIARHEMEPKKWEEWEEMGLPRTGQTVCKEHCRCMLIPSEFTVLEPIKREKRP